MDGAFLYFLSLLVVPFILLVANRGARMADQTARLRRVERKLDAVLNHLGVEADDRDGLSSQVRLYADSGQKIAAIKQYREDTGAGLAEAKEVVEQYLNRRPVRG